MDAPSLQLSLGALFFVHFFHHNIRFTTITCAKGSPGLKIWVAPSGGDLNTMKNIIGYQLRSQRWHRDRNGIGRIGVKSRMRLGSDRQTVADLQVEQDLVGVDFLAKRSKRWPPKILVGRGTEIAVEIQAVFSRGDVKFVLVGIKQFNPVLGTFRKW